MSQKMYKKKTLQDGSLQCVKHISCSDTCVKVYGFGAVEEFGRAHIWTLKTPPQKNVGNTETAQIFNHDMCLTR